MDMEYFARRRDRGLSPMPMPGVGMFEDEYEEEDAGDDEAGGNLDGAEEVSDDELLPDLEMPPARGEPSKKRPLKRGQGRKKRSGCGRVQPREMPENTVKPKMEGFNFPVEFFMKMYRKDSFLLLLDQTNIHRIQVRFFFFTRCTVSPPFVNFHFHAVPCIL
jgi:hypothetical protein